MTKVAEPTPTQPSSSGASPAGVTPGGAPRPRREPPFVVTFYRSAIAKKWLMAISGIALLGFVLAHMVGNLKLFLGNTLLTFTQDSMISAAGGVGMRTFGMAAVDNFLSNTLP